jgi:hypothetical protein
VKFLIRFNKTRGQPGRGTTDHAWRVFDMSVCPPKEYLAKNVVIHVPSRTERSGAGGPDDFNIACEGRMEIDRASATVHIRGNNEGA